MQGKDVKAHEVEPCFRWNRAVRLRRNSGKSIAGELLGTILRTKNACSPVPGICRPVGKITTESAREMKSAPLLPVGSGRSFGWTRTR